MWAPLAVLLMVVASAFGAIDTELPGPVPTVEWGTEVGRELPLDSATPTLAVATSASALIGEGKEAVPVGAASFVVPAPQLRELDQLLIDPIQPAVLDPLQTIPGFTLRTAQDAMPGVAGDPKLLSSFAGTPLMNDGRLSFEAGVQIPVFDDRPGLPEPEFLLQFRLQF